MINWETALAYCRGQSLVSHTTWRLPSIEGLHSLAIYANNPLIDGSVFYSPNTAGGLSGLPKPRRMIIILPIPGASMGKSEGQVYSLVIVLADSNVDTLPSPLSRRETLASLSRNESTPYLICQYTYTYLDDYHLSKIGFRNTRIRVPT